MHTTTTQGRSAANNLPPPRDDPAEVQFILNWLLVEAQRLLGARDTSKIIYRTVFSRNGDGPVLMNTDTGAFASLSANAGNYWPSFIYELSHETVHLLNPTIGPATWLEEGLAVSFSIHAQRLYGCKIQEPADGCYREALEMVRQLADGEFTFGQATRERFGSLSNFTAADLKAAFPAVPRSLTRRLAKAFPPWQASC